MIWLLLACQNHREPPPPPPGAWAEVPAKEGDRFFGWKRGADGAAVTRLVMLEEGKAKVTGEKEGIFVAAEGKIWALPTLACGAGALCLGPVEGAPQLENREILGSVGPYLYLLTRQEKDAPHFGVWDLIRGAELTTVYTPEEERLLFQETKSWVVRDFLLDPLVPDAGKVELAWVRPSYEEGRLRLNYLFAAASLPGQGDGIVGGDTRSIEKSALMVPRALAAWAVAPSVVQAAWQEGTAGGFSRLTGTEDLSRW